MDTASDSRATCWVISTRATARSRVPCRMVKPSEQIITTSPVLARPACHRLTAQNNSPMVSAAVITAWASRSFSM